MNEKTDSWNPDPQIIKEIMGELSPYGDSPSVLKIKNRYGTKYYTPRQLIDELEQGTDVGREL